MYVLATMCAAKAALAVPMAHLSQSRLNVQARVQLAKRSGYGLRENESAMLDGIAMHFGQAAHSQRFNRTKGDNTHTRRNPWYASDTESNIVFDKSRRTGDGNPPEFTAERIVDRPMASNLRKL